MNGLDDCSGHLGCSSLAAEVGRMETLISRYSLYTHNVEGRTVEGSNMKGKFRSGLILPSPRLTCSSGPSKTWIKIKKPKDAGRSATGASDAARYARSDQ